MIFCEIFSFDHKYISMRHIYQDDAIYYIAVHILILQFKFMLISHTYYQNQHHDFFVYNSLFVFK